MLNYLLRSFCLVFFIIGFSLAETQIFFDSDAPNDDGNGSRGEPYKYLYHASNLQDTYVTLYFKKSTTPYYAGIAATGTIITIPSNSNYWNFDYYTDEPQEVGNPIIFDGEDSWYIGVEVFSSNVNIIGITFQNFIEHGIKVNGGETVTVDGCTIKDMVGYPNTAISSAGIYITNADNITIKNSTILHGNVTTPINIQAQTDGIYIEGSTDIKILKNTIIVNSNYQDANTHDDCIQITWNSLHQTSSNILISHNTILNLSTIAGGSFADRQGIGIAKTTDDIQIFNNIICSKQGSNLIGVTYIQGTILQIYNNTLVGENSMYQVLNLENEGSGFPCDIKNNIFYKQGNTSRPALIRFHNISQDDVTYENLNYNLYNDYQPGSELNFDEVLVNREDIDINGQTTDPIFATMDYVFDLAYNSPAKNAGASLYDYVTDDFKGNKRPNWSGNDFDLGAYELPDAQIKIGVEGLLGSESVILTATAISGKWTKNIYGNYVLSSDASIASSSQTFNGNTTDFSLHKFWRGWSLSWYRHDIDSTSPIGLGFYKITNSLDDNYFYLDMRDASYANPYRPEIIIQFVKNQGFKYFGDEGFQSANGLFKNVWDSDLAASTHNISNLPSFWANNLVIVPYYQNNNYHPKLIWYSTYSTTYHLCTQPGGEWFEGTVNITSPYIDVHVLDPNGNVLPYRIKAVSEGTYTNTFTMNIYGQQEGKISGQGDEALSNNLNQNYPNPFNPSTNIQYELKEDAFVTLKIFDILGRELKSLVNEKKGAGVYTVEFNASNLPSGIYLCYFKANNFTNVRKMQLLK